MEALRKLTIKTAGFDIAATKEAVDAGKGKAALLNIAGIVNSAKPGQTDKGEYLKLIGDFRAVNLQTGEQFESSQAILPNFIADQFAGILSQSGTVEFALQIGAREDKSSVTGYQFTVAKLIDSKPSDRMQELIAASMKNTLALPPPAANKKAKGK